MIEVRFDSIFNKQWEKNLPKIEKYLKRNSDFFRLQVKDNYFCLISNHNVILVPILAPKNKNFAIEKILDIDSNSLLAKKSEDPCGNIDHLLNPSSLTEEKITVYFSSLTKTNRALHLSKIAYRIAKTFDLIVNIEDLEKIYVPLFESVYGSSEITIKANIIKNDNNEIEFAYFIFEDEDGIKLINASILPDEDD